MKPKLTRIYYNEGDYKYPQNSTQFSKRLKLAKGYYSKLYSFYATDTNPSDRKTVTPKLWGFWGIIFGGIITSYRLSFLGGYNNFELSAHYSYLVIAVCPWLSSVRGVNCQTAIDRLAGLYSQMPVWCGVEIITCEQWYTANIGWFLKLYSYLYCVFSNL